MVDLSAEFKGDLPEKTVKLDGKATVTFKPMTPKRFEEINDRYTVEKYKRGNLRSKTDWKKVISEILKETVVGWTGLEVEGGPIEVTDENRQTLYDNYALFRSAFTDVVMSGLADERDFAEELEGN